MPSAALTCPTMLPNALRLAPSIRRPHAGLVIMSTTFDHMSFGGTVSPFFRSLCRWPRICRSRVSISAEQRAAFARSISRRMNSRSRMT